MTKILNLDDYKKDKDILELLKKHLDDAVPRNKDGKPDLRSKVKYVYYKLSFENLGRKFMLPTYAIEKHLKTYMTSNETKNLFAFIDEQYRHYFLLSNTGNSGMMKDYAEHNLGLWNKGSQPIGDVYIQTLNILELEELLKKNLNETKKMVMSSEEFEVELVGIDLDD